MKMQDSESLEKRLGGVPVKDNSNTLRKQEKRISLLETEIAKLQRKKPRSGTGKTIALTIVSAVAAVSIFTQVYNDRIESQTSKYQKMLDEAVALVEEGNYQEANNLTETIQDKLRFRELAELKSIYELAKELDDIKIHPNIEEDVVTQFPQPEKVVSIEGSPVKTIYLANKDGTNKRAVIDGLDFSDYYNGRKPTNTPGVLRNYYDIWSPVLSPDSKRVAFRGFDDNNLYVIGINGKRFGDITQHMKAKFTKEDPVWLDKNTLKFQIIVDGKPEYRTVDLDKDNKIIRAYK